MALGVRLSRHPFFDHPGPLAFAHRGFCGGSARPGLENSMAAFAAAVELGYRYLETDVHCTSDGVLVAFHDHTLDRVTDGRGRVSELPYSRVSRARIGGAEPIPLVEEVLGTWPDVRVNIDVKHPGAVGPLADVLRRTRALHRVCIASFSDARRAAAMRALGPGTASSLGSRRSAVLLAAALARLPEAVGRAAVGDALAWQVPRQVGRLRIVTGRSLATAHRLGLSVHVWTIDDAAVMTGLLDLGVDGIMTDRADVLREVLRARGQWPS